MSEPIPHPPIVSRDAWLTARATLLQEEKELTRHYDRVAAQRRRLPMVKLEKDYEFMGLSGQLRLVDLFGEQQQLIVYHFMFGPDWEEGCPGCTGFIKEFGDLAHIETRDTTFALISRVPLEKLDAWKAQHGWSIPWYSSLGSDFNYDFHVSDERGEGQGISVFFRIDDTVYHTYSSYQRGVERVTDPYSLLDLTPYGRQEDFEDSPEGWPQRPTYG